MKGALLATDDAAADAADAAAPAAGGGWAGDPVLHGGVTVVPQSPLKVVRGSRSSPSPTRLRRLLRRRITALSSHFSPFLLIPRSSPIPSFLACVS